MSGLGLFGAAGFLLCLGLTGAPALAGTVLDRVRDAGVVRCGVAADQPAFARQDAEGAWRGFDIDLCRAVAAAAVGRADALQVLSLEGDATSAGLAEGRLDLLARGPAPQGLGAAQGARFATHTLIDGQGLLVPVAAKVGNVLSLNEAKVCIGPEGPLEDGLLRFARKSRIELTPLRLADRTALAAALLGGDCQAVSLGRSDLAALRAEHFSNPAAYEILPEVLSRDQMGPFVAPGDREWLSLVRWTVFALITAEEHGITRDTAERLRQDSPDPRVRRLLGVTEELGAGLGLDDAWAFRAILAVGNYGEVYDRHLGPGTPLALERGPNALWLDGGLLHAPPFR